MAKVETPIRFGFPLFTKDYSTDYIIKNKHIRISDLWAFWHYTIRMYKKKNTGCDLNFMLSLIEQAEYFYEAAENAPMKSQPLLYYYSFMNLAKIVINIDSFVGTTKKYHHGVSDKILSTTTISNAELKIANSSPNKLSVALEFMKAMGDTAPGAFPQTLLVKDLLKSCVGIHRTYCETYNEKETFHRLTTPCLLKDGMNLSFESEIKSCTAAVSTALVGKGYNISSSIIDGQTIYTLCETFGMTHYTPNRKDFNDLSKQLFAKGLWSYTNGNEYKLYISHNAKVYSSASIIYLIMYFLGSITRYHPYLFDQITSDKELWLVSEFLKNQPKQFINYVTSRTLGATLLNPDSNNI